MYLRTMHMTRNVVEGTSLKYMYMYHLLYNIHTGTVMWSNIHVYNNSPLLKYKMVVSMCVPPIKKCDATCERSPRQILSVHIVYKH